MSHRSATVGMKPKGLLVKVGESYHSVSEWISPSSLARSRTQVPTGFVRRFFLGGVKIQPHVLFGSGWLDQRSVPAAKRERERERETSKADFLYDYLVFGSMS